MKVAILIEFGWAVFITLRNYRTHLISSDQRLPSGFFNPASQITKAFNRYLFILAIPFVIFMLSIGIELQYLPPTVANIGVASAHLIFIYLFVSNYLSRAWQRTPFVAQFLGSLVVTQLILVSVTALIFAPIFSRTYVNDQLFPEGQNLLFTPQQPGYKIEKLSLSFDPELGTKLDVDNEASQEIEIPFSFPYFQETFKTFFLSDNQLITFGTAFDFRAMRNGLQPGVAVMAMDLDPKSPFMRADSGVYLKTSAEKSTITWYQLPLKASGKLSTSQLVLHASGQIEMAFVSHEPQEVYSFNALSSPWLIGLQTGTWSQKPNQISFKEISTTKTDNNMGIIEDYHIPFRSYLHQSMKPVLILLAAGLLLTMCGFPLFISYNILKPVQALAGAIDEVNRGNLDVSLRVLRNDEIGYLTDMFNQMVAAIREKNAQLHENSTTLETRVKQRTSMLADMTEKAEKARKEAIVANQTKSIFIANITHEIRTPLNAIIGFSDILREDVHDAGRYEWEKDLVRIRGAANDLLEMINNILDVSKIEAGRTTFYYDEFDLKSMVVEIIDLLKLIFKENNNNAGYTINASETVLLGDYVKIRQVLQNLLSNAAKFTRNGIIHVTIDRITEDNQFFYLIQVQDTGIGITNEQIDRIFEPFQQADNSITRIYGGSGLGLAISRQYAEMMGGRLWVESRQGVGSTFFLTLPIKPPSSAEVAKRIKANGTLVL
jgi:signal transduction histidine kinase